MKIMVTGGAGYIGSHCVLELLNRGDKVVILDNLSTGHKRTADTLKKYGNGNVDFYQADLLNKDQLADVFERNKDTDAVMHFAAFSQVNESCKNPSKYYENNVIGTFNLLNEMLKNGIKKIVFSSTAATYGDPVTDIIDETHPQIPVNAYGNTKLAIERMMDDLDKAHGLKSVRLRYFNVVGADDKGRVGEWHEPETHLLPNILRATEEKPFKLFGTDYPTKDGSNIRDLVNVTDLGVAHYFARDLVSKIARNGYKSEFINLGTKTGNSVKEIYELCKKITKREIPMREEGRREGDPVRLVANNEKAKRLLGWTPKHSLEDSIRTAAAWEEKLKEIKASEKN